MNGSEHFVKIVLHVLLQEVDLLFDNIKLSKNFLVLGVRLEKFSSARYESQHSEDWVGDRHHLSNCGGHLISSPVNRICRCDGLSQCLLGVCDDDCVCHILV